MAAGTRARPPGAAPDRRAQAVGAYGERVAERFLCSLGYVILGRNWRCALGEIDIVARDGTALVVCEVKTRRSGSYGTAVEQVTRVKAARLRSLAGAWVAAHPDHAGVTQDLRIDVIGVTASGRGPARVDHLVGVA